MGRTGPNTITKIQIGKGDFSFNLVNKLLLSGVFITYFIYKIKVSTNQSRLLKGVELIFHQTSLIIIVQNLTNNKQCH